MTRLGEFPPGFASEHEDVLVLGMRFTGDCKELDLFEPGCHIPSWYTYVDGRREQTSTPVSSNIYTGDWSKDGVREKCVIRMPFHETHSSGLTVDGDTSSHCASSYLALGITKRMYGSGHPCAFIMQKETLKLSQDCDHLIDLDVGKKSSGEWKPVALLAGYRQGSSSLGTVMAISPNGSRVAAATWSRVCVWSFEPESLIQGDLHLYFPAQDYNARKGFGRLRPTVLSAPEGVVHQLIWTKEESLFAITDRGLVTWDLGGVSTGEREYLELKFDTWPDAAIRLPAVGNTDGRDLPATLLDTRSGGL